MLNFDALPDLPQVDRLVTLATKLWTNDEVVALWLGGSFARGKADRYSDFDLRVAVKPEALESWRNPDFSSLFDHKYLGRQHVFSGPDAILNQVALESNVLFDFWVQTTSFKPPDDAVLVLGCRDDQFAAQLVSVEIASAYDPGIAEPETVRQVIVDFWINSGKHTKVLSRSLDALAQIGITLEKSVLMRLWHILATGRDTGSKPPTIHALTPIIRAVESAMGDTSLAISGAPTRNRVEIIAAIDLNRSEVSRVGKLLAEQLNFEYPQTLEASVRKQWLEFQNS